MNILIPINGFYKGGGNRVLSELANNWIKLGHTVQFLSINDSSLPYFPTIASISWVNHKGEPVDIVMKKKRTFFSALREQITLYKALNFKHKAGERWDVILANHSSTALPIYFTQLKGLKVYYIQAYEPEMIKEAGSLKSWFISQISRKTYNLDLLQIVNSPIYYRYKNIRANYFIPPGLDLERYYPKLVTEISFDGVIKLGCVGRIEPNKGTKYVLDAFKILQDEGFNCELHIAFGSIPKSSASLKNIITIQPKSDDELAAFYRNCQIIIAPGIIQFGAPHYPVLEAMAVQTPLITTYYLGCTSSNCWMVAPQSAKAIADNVKFIVTNKDEAIRRAIRAREGVLSFDWRTVSKNMIDLFEENR